MKKHIHKFNILFVLAIFLVWIIAPDAYPISGRMCETTAARVQVAAYNTFIKNVNAQTENTSIAAITFDDGFQSVYTNAYPILKKYDYTASIAVIGNRIGEYEYLTYKQLGILYRSGYEILNHSYTHKQNEDSIDKKIISEYRKNRILLKVGGFSKGSNIIVTPGGVFGKNYISDAYKSGFTAIRTLKNLYLVKENKRADVRIINVYGSRPMKDIKSEINQAYKTNQSIILVFHKIENTPLQSEMYVSTENFEEIIEYLSLKHFNVVSYEELIAYERSKD